MRNAQNYFNAHANANRVSTLRRHDLSGHMPAPAILKKDEIAYSLAMEKNAQAKRKVSVTLAATPW